MSKRLIVSATAASLVIALGIFTISNAFAAVNFYEEVAYYWSPSAPLSTTAVQWCKILKQNYQQDIANAKTKGLSLQLTPEQIQHMIDYVVATKDRTCLMANDRATFIRMCLALRTTQGKEVRKIKTKGLSSQLTQTQIQALIDRVTQYRNDICNKARGG